LRPERLRPGRSRRSRGTLLVAAISGRALAQAAVDAGFDALVADFFADADTARLAHACLKLPGDIARGFQWGSLARALEALAKQAPSPLLGLVYGSGFEDRPRLLARLAERWPLLGNDAETVVRIKAPETFFAALDALAIPHPAPATTRPRNGAGWIAKRRGGAGGSHVVPSRLQKDATGAYYQAFVAGRAVSALFLANGSKACVLGFSEQWTAPAPRRLWRYGGAVQPAALSEETMEAMTRAVTLLASEFGLKGLASADFVLAENRPLLLEINPRPGATLDIFACAKKPLLKLHVDAVLDGTLPRKPLVFEGAAASSIVHAPKSVIVPRNMTWPSWAADLPKPGERIDKQRPICTVLARAGTEARAKRLAETRKASLLAKIQEPSKGDECERQEERRKRNTSDEKAERQHTGRAAHRRDHR
jgi:predicted ATP-grasp superfamily ATP-dependent carboligase